MKKKSFNFSFFEKFLLLIYDLFWAFAIPLLKFNKRLAKGFDERSLKILPQKADLWIHGASVGEAYLAREILKNLRPGYPLRVLVTANTGQGIKILKEAAKEQSENNLIINTAFFPFDRPAVMKKAIKAINPGLIVMLETELWPGLFFHAALSAIPVLIANGRISQKSLKFYLGFKSFWEKTKPREIMAISQKDAARYEKLFPESKVKVVSNIKFDRIKTRPGQYSYQYSYQYSCQYSYQYSCQYKDNPLRAVIPGKSPFLVMGSVRKKEEDDIEKIILYIKKRKKNTIIGLFPRHIKRVIPWTKRLDRLNMLWVLRSGLKSLPVNNAIIIWDVFGELNFAYEIAKAVFVGGSLAPLGGHNFLEPVTCGVIPVTGPFWDDFAWAGKDMENSGLLRIEKDWKAVAKALINNLDNPDSRKDVLKKADEFFSKKKGGVKEVCMIIGIYLQSYKNGKVY